MATYEVALDALGDSTRRQILERLRSGPASVGQLAAALPVSRPAVSQHLKVLKDTGLVTFEPQGTSNIYRLEPAGLDELRQWLDGFWQAALDGFEAYVDRRNQQRRSQ